MRPSNPDAKPRAAIYSRISSDPEGTEDGVKRQELDCIVLAERLGYEVVEPIYRENDVSASTKSLKPRPVYAQMLAEARAGHFEAIISYSNSRLTRRPREFEDLIDLYEKHGVQMHTVASGSFDLATADGRRMARFLAGEATAEAERTAERVKRAKAQNALDGKYRGGPKPFGFEKDGVTINPREAQAIREATAGILAGRSLAAVAEEMNQQGLTGTFGKRWSYNNLRDMLLRPRNAGLIAVGLPGRKGRGQHQPDWSFDTDVVKGKDGEPVKAVWEAIVPVEQWRALIGILSDPERRTNQTTELRWPLSGIARCGEYVTQLDEEGHPVYNLLTDDNGEPLYTLDRYAKVKIFKDGKPRQKRQKVYALDVNGEKILCGKPLRTAPHGGTHSRQGERRYLYRCTASAHLTISAKETDEYVLGYVSEYIRDPRVLAALEPQNGQLTADREKRAALAARIAQFDDDYTNGRIPAALWQRSVNKVQDELEAVDDRLAKSVKRSLSREVISAADPGAAFLLMPLDIQRAIISAVVSVSITSMKATGRVNGTVWNQDRVEITPIV